MNKTTTYTVSIGNQSTRVRIQNDSADEFGCPVDAVGAEIIARNRMIEKLFGASAFWWADSGLSGYGQVCKPSTYGGSDCITNRVRIDVEADSEFPVNEAGRAEYFAYMREAQQEMDRELGR